MTDNKQLAIEARWDRDLVPAGMSCQRNLLLEIMAPPASEDPEPGQPVNLSLVIDRSSSMSRFRLDAAKSAAAGIIERLGNRDRLSLVTFDDVVETLVDGIAMDETGKREAFYLLEQVFARGTTDLGAGWFEGARCAASLLESGKFSDGNVLILSDGQANRGICDPEKLQLHANELSGRGIKTSAIGIGEGYSPLQLDALAEGGGGRLHDAESTDDIIEVVQGELGELHNLTARDVHLTIECPEGINLELLTRSKVIHEGNRYSVRIGDLGADAKSPVAIRADVPAFKNMEFLPFKIEIEWLRSSKQQIPGRVSIDTPLRVVPTAEAEAQVADGEIVEHVATLWESVLAYRSIRMNERRDFAGANGLYEQTLDSYRDLVSPLDDAEERLSRVMNTRAKVSRQWDGRTKRQAYTLSKKSIMAERDLRRKVQGDWHDYLDK